MRVRAIFVWLSEFRAVVWGSHRYYSQMGYFYSLLSSGLNFIDPVVQKATVSLALAILAPRATFTEHFQSDSDSNSFSDQFSL